MVENGKMQNLQNIDTFGCLCMFLAEFCRKMGIFWVIAEILSELLRCAEFREHEIGQKITWNFPGPAKSLAKAFRIWLKKFCKLSPDWLKHFEG